MSDQPIIFYGVPRPGFGRRELKAALKQYLAPDAYRLGRYLPKWCSVTVRDKAAASVLKMVLPDHWEHRDANPGEVADW